MHRVSKIISKKDGVVQVAKVQMADRRISRAVRKLYPLPIEVNQSK